MPVRLSDCNGWGMFGVLSELAHVMPCEVAHEALEKTSEIPFKKAYWKDNVTEGRANWLHALAPAMKSPELWRKAVSMALELPDRHHDFDGWWCTYHDSAFVLCALITHCPDNVLDEALQLVPKLVCSDGRVSQGLEGMCRYLFKRVAEPERCTAALVYLNALIPEKNWSDSCRNGGWVPSTEIISNPLAGRLIERLLADVRNGGNSLRTHPPELLAAALYPLLSAEDQRAAEHIIPAHEIAYAKRKRKLPGTINTSEPELTLRDFEHKSRDEFLRQAPKLSQTCLAPGVDEEILAAGRTVIQCCRWWP